MNEIVNAFYKLGYDKIINNDGNNNFIALGEFKNIIINKKTGNYFAYTTSGECMPIELNEHKLIHRLLYFFELLNYE